MLCYVSSEIRNHQSCEFITSVTLQNRFEYVNDYVKYLTFILSEHRFMCLKLWH